MTPEIAMFANVIVFGAVLAIVVVLCWIVLPFAVLGTKPILRQLLDEQRRTNELLAKLSPAKRE